MQQHPVPQNVTQYQFRLVGDMTLKQFLELAGGLVLAWLFYASNLIFLIKWPFALLSLFFGIALAFFPIEERPLDVWIINFLKSIYAPTRFIWTKTTRLPSFFKFEPHEIVEKVTATKTVKAPPLPIAPTPEGPDLTEGELAKIHELDSLLVQSEKTAPRSGAKTPSEAVGGVGQKPSVKVRRLNPVSVIFDAKLPTPAPIPRPTPPPAPEPKEVAVPKIDPTPVEKSPNQPSTMSHEPSTISPDVFVAAPSVQAQNVQAASAAQTIQLPAAPQKPNLVVGMVVTKEGNLVENAIVEILTGDGIPARAIKTNSLGQFFISTPLAQGDYTIQAEKEGLAFAPQSLQADNHLIPPLLLRAS